MVDTGIDITHPDLINNLWMNQAEKNGPGATAANGYKNGIDDDGNGESTPQLHLLTMSEPSRLQHACLAWHAFQSLQILCWRHGRQRLQEWH